jgi:hypothetical protein
MTINEVERAFLDTYGVMRDKKGNLISSSHGKYSLGEASREEYKED